MQWLADICVRRPVFALVLMLFVLVVGVAGYSRLGVDQFPNVDIPIVVVTTTLTGAAPEEIESDITEKIEAAVNTIAGVDELQSFSTEGVSVVTVIFKLDRNIDVAAQDVRDHINTVLHDLPKNIDPPEVAKVDPGSTPVILLGLYGDASVRQLSEIADKLVRRQIESISGVGEVRLVGAQKRQINIWLDPIGLAAHGLTALDVQRKIGSQNLTAPGGVLEDGPVAATLRIEGRVETVEELRQMALRYEGNHPIRLVDVARVEDASEEEESWAQLGPQRTVVLAVRKQSGGNTVATVDAVTERLGEIASSLPEGVHVQVVRDNSSSIRTGIDSVREHLLVGAIFAAIVVLLFLGSLRTTIISALAIPVSIIGTFGVMWVQGFTLNFLTLLALALSVGIVIDDAIVVLENIVRFIDEKKQKPFVATVLATREIGLAVLATTLSLMAVFLPVSFMPGIAGRFLKSFGLTMAFAILVSLIVSFSLTPALAARWLRPTLETSRLQRFVDAFYKPIEHLYMRMLGWSMSHRKTIVALCALSLYLCVPMKKMIPSSFLPLDDRAQFEVSLRAPEGTSLTATRLLVERVQSEVMELSGVEAVLMTVADDQLKTQNLASLSVQLSDPKTRSLTQFDIMDVVRRQLLTKLPDGFRATVNEISDISTGGKNANVTYGLVGPDLDKLATYGQNIVKGLTAAKAATDVDSSLILGKPQLKVKILRDRTADLGVEVQDIASVLQLYVGGLKISNFADAGEEYDIRLRASADARATAASLSLVTVPSHHGSPVTLNQVTEMILETGPAQINRMARQRQVIIYANSAPGYGESDVVTALFKLADEQSMPAGYKLIPTGRSRSTAETAQGFAVAFGLSFIFMYLILAAQFESWIHPLTILITLPLTVPFALFSLIIFKQSLNMFSALGLLVLFGVVKKNAILQIDHTNHLRAQGKDRLTAILEANRDRLRPILMTTVAFVAGMIPLMTGRGIGSGLNRGIAGIVLGGQTFSLLLTLLATPVFYSLLDDLVVWSRKQIPKGLPFDSGEADLDTL